LKPLKKLKEVVDFLKDLKNTQVLGQFSDGLLLVGPPGTGILLLANRAGEAGVPFFNSAVQILWNVCRLRRGSVKIYSSKPRPRYLH
jgi:hypothetical protein